MNRKELLEAIEQKKCELNKFAKSNNLSIYEFRL